MISKRRSRSQSLGLPPMDAPAPEDERRKKNSTSPRVEGPGLLLKPWVPFTQQQLQERRSRYYNGVPDHNDQHND